MKTNSKKKMELPQKFVDRFRLFTICHPPNFEFFIDYANPDDESKWLIRINKKKVLTVENWYEKYALCPTKINYQIYPTPRRQIEKHEFPVEKKLKCDICTQTFIDDQLHYPVCTHCNRNDLTYDECKRCHEKFIHIEDVKICHSCSPPAIDNSFNNYPKQTILWNISKLPGNFQGWIKSRRSLPEYLEFIKLLKKRSYLRHKKNKLLYEFPALFCYWCDAIKTHSPEFRITGSKINFINKFDQSRWTLTIENRDNFFEIKYSDWMNRTSIHDTIFNIFKDAKIPYMFRLRFGKLRKINGAFCSKIRHRSRCDLCGQTFIDRKIHFPVCSFCAKNTNKTLFYWNCHKCKKPFLQSAPHICFKCTKKDILENKYNPSIPSHKKWYPQVLAEIRLQNHPWKALVWYLHFGFETPGFEDWIKTDLPVFEGENKFLIKKISTRTPLIKAFEFYRELFPEPRRATRSRQMVEKDEIIVVSSDSDSELEVEEINWWNEYCSECQKRMIFCKC
jgi:hypothetical protein